MDIFSEKTCFKKPVLPKKPAKKPAFNLPAGFFNKTWVFSSPALNSHHQSVSKEVRKPNVYGPAARKINTRV
jgi:hypothetical protein